MGNGGLSDYMEQTFLDTILTGGYAALTSDAPTDASYTEMTTNGCTRKSVTLSRSGSTISNTADLTFGPATGGSWARARGVVVLDASSGGNRRFHGELINNPVVVTADATANTLNATSHGKANNTVVVIRNENGTLPGGLSAGTQEYFVINSNANDFQVSLTEGGSAVDITSIGNGTHKVYDCHYQTAALGNEVKIPSASLSLTLD